MSEPNLNEILSGGGLSSLLQNPEVAAKLPRIMEALKPVMAEMQEEGREQAKAEEKPEKKAEENAEEKAALPPPTQKKSSTTTRFALLKALEPYLSEERKAAMETILKVSSLIDLISEVM